MSENQAPNSDSPSTVPTIRPSSTLSSPISKRPNGMNAFIFPKLFHSFLPEEARRLQLIYSQLGGELPSKRGLKALSNECGIAQTKIRKWFAMQESKPLPVREIAENLGYLEEAKEVVEEIRGELQQIRATNSSLQHLLQMLD